MASFAPFLIASSAKSLPFKDLPLIPKKILPLFDSFELVLILKFFNLSNFLFLIISLSIFNFQLFDKDLFLKIIDFLILSLSENFFLMLYS